MGKTNNDRVGNMKKNMIGFLIVLFFKSIIGEDEMRVVVNAQQVEKMSIAFVIIDRVDNEFVTNLKKYLEMTGQYNLKLIRKRGVTKESEIKMLFDQGCSMALFISQDRKNYSWRLYDTIESHMIEGKKFLGAHKSIQEAAQNVADYIWQTMMGNYGSFSSKIAFCRQKIEKKHGKDRFYKQILLADIDGSHELLIDLPTISFAPRWNQNPEVPVLFYSENTVSNVRLMMSNMYGKRRVVCSFDGLNMQPAFSDDGNEIVFCLSKDGSTQLYRSYISGESRKYIRLTHNKGNNFAPCFVDKETIVFVSDYKANSPQLYFMNIKTQEITPITTKGYNVCPCYSKVKHQIVYSKMVAGKMQLFIYDCKSKKDEQITSGSIFSNEEPSWSPCGNFIVYCANQEFNGRIVCLNMATKETKYITPKNWNCSYPSWSPVYTSWLE